MGRIRFFGNKSKGSVRIADFASLLDTEVIVIGNKTFEWDDNAAVTAGNVLVTIGASDAISITNLRDAINANKPTPPVDAVVDPKDTKVLRIEATNRGAAGNMAFTTDMADADNIIAAVADKLDGGENGGQQTLHRDVYTVTALDVLADNIMIPTGIPNTPRFRQVEFLSAAGLQRNTVTALVTLVGKDLRIDFAGAVDLVAGDLVVWQVWE